MASERDLADGGKPKQTLFISLLNGTEEDMEALYNAFTSVPDLVEKYHGIVTAKPVQTMDPLDLIIALKHIHNVKEDGDPTNDGLTRTEKFRILYRKVYEFMEQMCYFAEHVAERFKVLSATAVPVMLPDRQIVYGHIVNPWSHHSSIDRMRIIRDQVAQHKPNEGEEW